LRNSQPPPIFSGQRCACPSQPFTQRTFWILVAWQTTWIGAATAGLPLLDRDPYPFAFCRFLSNLIQLWALPLLGASQNRAAQRHEVKADADHQALTHIATVVNQIAAQTKGTTP
jgi:uncharacterized membrane protein